LLIVKGVVIEQPKKKYKYYDTFVDTEVSKYSNKEASN
jgi:hypothetical protein